MNKKEQIIRKRARKRKKRKHTLTDSDKDKATAPLNPDHTRMMVSFHSKPYPKYRRNGYNMQTTIIRDN